MKRKYAIAVLFLLSVAFVLSPLRVKADQADVKTLYPTADAWLDAGNPNTNDNSSADLYLSRNTAGNITKASVVKFDLSSIPADAHLTSGILNLFLRDCSSDYQYFNVGQLSRSWSESSVAWSTVLTFLPNPTSFNQSTCVTGQWYHISITSIASNWLSGQENDGFYIFPVSGLPNSAYSRTFYSRHNAQFKPELVLAYTYPDAVVPPSTPPAGTTGQTGSPATSNTTGTTTVTAPTSTSAAAKKTIDTAIASPTLEYIFVGETRTNAPMAGESVLTVGDILKIGGKSFANAGIAIIIGEKAYTGTADKDGKWELTIDTKDITAGDYKVTAQAQDTTKNKGSSIVELFSLKINAKTVANTTLTPGPDKLTSPWTRLLQLLNQYRWYMMGALLLIALGLSALLIYLIKKENKK